MTDDDDESAWPCDRIVEFKETRRKAALLREQHNMLITRVQEETQVMMFVLRGEHASIASVPAGDSGPRTFSFMPSSVSFP